MHATGRRKQFFRRKCTFLISEKNSFESLSKKNKQRSSSSTRLPSYQTKIHTFSYVSFLKNLLCLRRNMNFCCYCNGNIQSNSVITNSTRPWIYVCYNNNIVITANVYVVKPLLATKKYSKIRLL